MRPREHVLERLADGYTNLSPQLRRAAQYVLDHPNEVGVNSMRQIAAAAHVKPNTLVRMARTLGFHGYEEFRQPFIEELRSRVHSFPDRARWLQSIARGRRHGRLYSQMAATSLGNLEELYSTTHFDQVKAVADLILKSSNTYIFGVGSCYSLAHNFWYVARMAFDHLVLVPRHGSLPIDDIARIGERDVLIAMTFSPYRSEVVDAAVLAKKNGGKVVSISDSRASPIALQADRVLTVTTDTPQFFPSVVASMSLLEALIAFMVADADQNVVAKIDHFHRVRYESGVYCSDKV